MTSPATVDLSAFLDREGRFRTWPTKRPKQQAALAYLQAKFEVGRLYSEREVNDLLREWHTFGDWARLRRDLWDHGFLERSRDGRRYWRG